MKLKTLLCMMMVSAIPFGNADRGLVRCAFGGLIPLQVKVTIGSSQDEDLDDDDDVDDDDDGESDGEGEGGVGRYIGGAMLKTDPDLVALLNKADQYQKDGNYQVAIRYWQTVLEQSGDTLYSDNGETYYSMTERVESILTELPLEGLRAYRISADANAKEIMAQSKGDFDVEILSKIVKSYFISSLGDEAAYQLAGIFMDQFDFVAATRLLRKITDQYPSPSVSMGDVWLKLSVAYTYLGDTTMAQQALANAQQIGGTSSAIARDIRSFVESSPKLSDNSLVMGDWTMRMGGPRRHGLMNRLPDGYLDHDLAATWQYYFSPLSTFDESNYSGNVLMGDAAHDTDRVFATVDSKESNLIHKWRERRWRPSADLLIYDDQVLFKTGGDVTVWDRQPEESPRWRPLWFNKYVEDDASRMLREMMVSYGRRTTAGGQVPDDSLAIQYFSDRVHQSTSVYRGVVYNVEGENYSVTGKPPREPTSSRRGFQYGQLPKRNRVNALTAYDARTGKLLWRQPPVSELKEQPSTSTKQDPQSDVGNPFEGIGFMSAPVGVGDLVLVPIIQGGAISLYALHSGNGELVWRAYLCDDPASGGQPYSPIDITVDGSSAYVTCGTGVLFAVDPLTGGIQFARRYERSGKEDSSLQHIGVSGQMIMDGWEHDLVIPIGNILLLFSSDYSAIWAIDRQTAKFIWRTENRPFNSKFEYLIGIHGDKIYLGGQDSIAAVSISAQGRWEWVEEFGDEISFGRAMVTPDGIYVPIEDSIAQYSLDGQNGRGELVRRVGVRLGTNAPVGNLYSDGEKIWVVGANRLYALSKLTSTSKETKPSDGATNEAEAEPTGGGE